MSRAIPLPLMLLIIVTLAGCGGGGGGGSSGGGGGGGSNVTGISLSPSTMSFTANHDDPDAPPAQTVTITALGSGTTYIRFENGTATGLSCNGTSSCTFPVRPTSAPYSFVSPNTTTDAITFIGCADQTCTTGPVPNGRQTLTYTYAVTPGLDISPASALIVNGVEGVPTPSQTLTLTHPSGTVPPWHATFTPTGAGPAFVTLSPVSAAAAGTATLQAQFASLPAGTYTGTIEIQPGTSPRRVRRDVTYNVQSAFKVTGNMSFVIDAATQSAASQQTWTAAAGVGVAGTLGWTASVNTPWLQLSRATGDTASANQIVVSLLPAKLEQLPKGVYTADIRFDPVVPAAFSVLTVHVSLDMRLPHTAFVMPRAVGEGSTGEAFISGSGFAVLPGTLKFGSTDATPPVTRDSDALIRASYPATLSSGHYNIDLSIPTNALGLNRQRARFTVLSPTTLQSATADIAVPTGKKYAAVFDDARLALYVANVVDPSPATSSTIQRLVWDGGSWTLDAKPVALLRDIALSPGGDELLALTAGDVTRIDPDAWSVIDSVTVPSPGSVPNRSFAAGNDGRLSISQADGGTSTNITYYNLTDGAFASEFACCISGNIRASGDGTSLYLLGDTNTRRYDVKMRTYTDNSAVGSATGRSLSVSLTGARFIIDGTTVYRSDFTKVGTLPAPSGEIFNAATITPDGTRAFAYGVSGKLYGFQLDSFVGADFAPVPGTPVTLPHLVDSPVMTTSSDGRAVFIAGGDRIIVKSVGP